MSSERSVNKKKRLEPQISPALTNRGCKESVHCDHLSTRNATNMQYTLRRANNWPSRVSVRLPQVLEYIVACNVTKHPDQRSVIQNRQLLSALYLLKRGSSHGEHVHSIVEGQRNVGEGDLSEKNWCGWSFPPRNKVYPIGRTSSTFVTSLH